MKTTMLKALRWTPFLLAAAVFLHAPAAFGQACDDSGREEAANLIANGATAADIDAMFGHCRDFSGQTELPVGLSKSLTVTNTGSVAYEEMNSCGYHPANENLFCDVEIKRRTGFIGAAGSQEYVLFCYDCDRNGTYDYQSLGSVHVTDDVSGGPLSFYFNASSSTLPASSALCTVNDSQAGDVRAILSWVVQPTDCNFIPVWGNQIDFTVRRDP